MTGYAFKHERAFKYRPSKRKFAASSMGRSEKRKLKQPAVKAQGMKPKRAQKTKPYRTPQNPSERASADNEAFVATSASAERLFSIAGLAFDDFRQNMKDGTLQNLL